MINTNKDIEVKFAKLEREIDFLKRELKRGGVTSGENSNKTEIIYKTQVVNQSVDSELTADASSVWHKLLHYFNWSLFRHITIQSGIDEVQFRITDQTDKNGSYFIATENIFRLASGASFNGTDWVAQDTEATVLVIVPGTGLYFFSDTGLTIGNTFTPTQRFFLQHNGNLVLTTPLSVGDGGTGSTTAAGARGNLDVYSKGEITTNHYTKTQSDANYYSKSTIDAMFANYYNKTDIDAFNTTQASVNSTLASQISTTWAAKADHGTYSVSGGGGGTVSI